jgi:hypothetical protein
MFGAQFQYTVLPLLRSITSITSAIITLDFNNLFNKLLVGSAAITQNSTIVFTNDLNTNEFYFVFEITGGLYTLTMPADVMMSYADFVAGAWTPPAEGRFVMHGIYDGTNWNVEIQGPYDN